MPASSHQHCKKTVQRTQDDRVRAILGVRDGSLPPIEQEALRKYYRYLSGALWFPLSARYHEAASVLEDITHTVTVLGLIDPADNVADEGLLCRAVKDGKTIEVPLVELEVDRQSRNFQLIEDYWY